MIKTTVIFKYLYALVVSVLVIFFVWFLLTSFSITLRRVSLIGLIPPIVAGFLGGALSAIIAPSHKITVAVVAAIIVISPMLYFLLKNGFSHFSQNPILWYWPIYVPLASVFGAILTPKLAALIRWMR